MIQLGTIQMTVLRMSH